MSASSHDSTDPNFKDRDGLMQIVMVGRLTYAWDGVDLLEVGDVVRLPSNWSNPNGWQGTVTAVGSAYAGELRLIEKRVRTAAEDAKIQAAIAARQSSRPPKRDPKLSVTRPNG